MPQSRKKWRRGWDSNPRLSFPNTRFPSVLLKPLGHLSAACCVQQRNKLAAERQTPGRSTRWIDCRCRHKKLPAAQVIRAAGKSSLKHLRSEFHCHRLDLGVIVQRVFAKFAANARLFVTAKRSGSIEHVETIHPYGSRAHRIRNRVGLADLASPPCRCRAVEGLVSSVDDFVQILKAQNRHDRPKYFFLGDFHVVLHVTEYGRLNEIAFVADAVAARKQLGVILFPRVDVAHYFIELIAVHLRALFCLLVERIAHRPPLRPRHALLDEFVVALFLDEKARSRIPTLSLTEEQTRMPTLDRLIHIGIGKNDVRALTTELECYALEIRRRGRLHDQSADFCRAGKRNFIHVHVIRDSRACGGSVTRQQIHHARRETGFDKQFTYSQCRKRGLFGGLHHHGASRCQRGTKLPRLHQQREIPRNNLADDADGFVARVTEVIPIYRDRLALNLVCPSRVVAKAGDDERQARRTRHRIGLPIVERLELCQFVGVLLDQVR